jgi:excisionase family DNA binding protein
MNYKAKQRASKIDKSNTETIQIITKPIEVIKAKEFLTVRDLSKLLNCSIRTAYNIIERGDIKAVKVSDRKTLIKRSEVDKLFA